MKLFYRKYGNGPTMIIVHGLYGSGDNWTTIAKALGKHFEVYVIDLRNHGRSPHSDDHNYSLMRDDLYGFMKEHNIKKTVLLGHSMGGKTVMFFAATFPELVTGLVVVDIAPKSYKLTADLTKRTTDHKKILETIDKIQPEKMSSREEIDRLLAKDIESERVRSFLLKNLERTDSTGYRWKLNIKVLNANLDLILNGINAGDFKGNGHAGRQDAGLGDEISGFPVLFLRGARSNYIQDADTETIKSIFPYADIVLIPDAGHWMHVEQAQLLIKAVKEYILG